MGRGRVCTQPSAQRRLRRVLQTALLGAWHAVEGAAPSHSLGAAAHATPDAQRPRSSPPHHGPVLTCRPTLCPLHLPPSPPQVMANTVLCTFSGFLITSPPVYWQWITKISYVTYAYQVCV